MNRIFAVLLLLAFAIPVHAEPLVSVDDQIAQTKTQLAIVNAQYELAEAQRAYTLAVDAYWAALKSAGVTQASSILPLPDQVTRNPDGTITFNGQVFILANQVPTPIIQSPYSGMMQGAWAGMSSMSYGASQQMMSGSSQRFGSAGRIDGNGPGTGRWTPVRNLFGRVGKRAGGCN